MSFQMKFTALLVAGMCIQLIFSPNSPQLATATVFAIILFGFTQYVERIKDAEIKQLTARLEKLEESVNTMKLQRIGR